MGLVDDLRAALAGVGQLVDGGRKVAKAAGAVADRVDVVLEHVTNDETVARVAQAALGAGIEAAGHEIRTAVAKRPAARIREREPRKRARECLGIACSLHGNQEWGAWRKTIVCGGAEGRGRVYQTADAHSPRFARALSAHAGEASPAGGTGREAIQRGAHLLHLLRRDRRGVGQNEARPREDGVTSAHDPDEWHAPPKLLAPAPPLRLRLPRTALESEGG